MSNFTIDSELPSDVLDSAKKRAASAVEEQLQTEGVPQISIPHKCTGQEFCVMAILGSECRQKSDVACVNFLGAFSTIDHAQQFAKDVSEVSPHFDLYCASMYKWLPLNTRPEDAANTHWRNEKVEKLMQDYMNRKALSKEIFEERKRLCTKSNVDDTSNTDNTNDTEKANTEKANTDNTGNAATNTEKANDASRL